MDTYVKAALGTILYFVLATVIVGVLWLISIPFQRFGLGWVYVGMLIILCIAVEYYNQLRK